MIFSKLKLDKRGEMEEVIKIALWILFIIIGIGAVYFLLNSLGVFS